MRNKKTIQVICPVLNEALVIEHFYQNLRGVLENQKDRYEWSVIFVVDRSQDNTLEILRSLAKDESRVMVLALSARFGHQMSLVAGIDHSNADAIIMMDSDMQHPPVLIPDLLDAYEKGFEVVYTIRQYPGDSSPFKGVVSRLFYIFINKMSEIPIQAGAADFRLISRRVASIFQTQIRERNQFLRGLFGWVGFKSIGIPYKPEKRLYGKSKYSFSRMIQFAVSGLVSFSKKPLQYATSLGFLFALLGLVFTGYSIVQYFINEKMPSGWTTLATLISVFGGLQLIFLGILGEYVGAIFDEVKARPLYLVEEKINIE